MNQKTLTIDGVELPFDPGQTIMEAATAFGVYIHHLCHHPEFKPHGSCNEVSGHCKLQATAYALGMLDSHFPHFFPVRRIDASHPDMMLDLDRCILCELCVRASRDMDGKSVFGIAGRGMESHLVVHSESGALVDTLIEVSDRAANVCPVGAILIKHQAYEKPIGQRRYDHHPIQAILLHEDQVGGSHDE
ncbi:MAG: NADP oxidoreductase [Gammaproteobacteria bacterium]|nr:NADP oxidoreductase [Gammaproteobacteria bacterium]